MHAVSLTPRKPNYWKFHTAYTVPVSRTVLLHEPNDEKNQQQKILWYCPIKLADIEMKWLAGRKYHMLLVLFTDSHHKVLICKYYMTLKFEDQVNQIDIMRDIFFIAYRLKIYHWAML
jgi:hypothetical protein